MSVLSSHWWALGSQACPWNFSARRKRRSVAAGVDPGCRRRGRVEQAMSRAIVGMSLPVPNGGSGVGMGVLYAMALRADTVRDGPALRQVWPFDSVWDDLVCWHPLVHPIRCESTPSLGASPGIIVAIYVL